MELFRLLGRIVIDNTEANRVLNDTTRNANDSSNRMSKAFEKIGKAAKGIAIGIGTVGTAVGGAFIATIEGTREFRKEMGLLESAFNTAGHSSETAKKTYSDLNAVLGDTGQAVGELSPSINARLGDLYKHNERGNTR